MMNKFNLTDKQVKILQVILNQTNEDLIAVVGLEDGFGLKEEVYEEEFNQLVKLFSSFSVDKC